MDDRRGEPRRDEAVFGSARVNAAGGRRPWFWAGALLAALGSVVVTGILQGPAPERARAAATEAAAATSLVAAGQPRSERFRGEALTGPAGKPPPLVQVAVRPNGDYLFVHGEVFSAQVEVVVVSLRDPRRQTADIRTVHVPGGSTAFRLGAVDRFDVQFARPEPPPEGGLTVEVNCYDGLGAQIGSIEAAVPPLVVRGDS